MGESYRFVADDVQIRQAPILNPESISGSTAAMAIAGGLVSLFIVFCRLAHEDGLKPNGAWRTRIAKWKLNAMCMPTETGWTVVVPDNICGRRKRLMDADFMAEVRNHFRC